MARLQGRKDILFDLLAAPAHIRNDRVARQFRDQALVDDAFGFRRQGQNGKHEIGDGEEIVEPVPAVIAGHALDRLRRPAPARDREAEARHLAGHSAADGADPHDAHPGVGRIGRAQIGPFAAVAHGVVLGHTTVKVQQRVNRPMGHIPGQIGIDEARNRHPLRAVRIVQDVVDPRAQLHDRLEAGQFGEHARRDAADDEHVDLRPVAESGPDPHIESGIDFVQTTNPFRVFVAPAMHQKRHIFSSPCTAAQ
ncbi:MAG: hypothetical protein O3A96_13640 [Proteobacteria bacterium]|nr:hypothetical protein [Pseudomonadota bacterium]